MRDKKHAYDIRWPARLRKVTELVDNLDGQLMALYELDEKNVKAVWQGYARDASGCIAGIRQLLYKADSERDGQIERDAQVHLNSTAPSNEK